MIAYLDTSSLLKLYHEEGSVDIETYLQKNVEEIYLSELAKLEFRSAILRKIRMNEIPFKIGLDVISCFHADYDNYYWIELQRDIMISASELLMKYGNKGLRTLDAIQLACAVTLRKDDCVFLTSDELLKSLFLEEKLNVLE